MRVTEMTIQAALMSWVMNEKSHQFVLPNSTGFFYYGWEADLISVTKAGLCHEYEIKLTRKDYKRDALKWKHKHIGNASYTPAYFWYATYGFEIEPPDNAGWLLVSYDIKQHMWTVTVKKNPPRLNTWKIPEKKVREIARLLSWRLTGVYGREVTKFALECRAEEERAVEGVM